MSPIQIMFLTGLAGAWLALVFPLAVRGRHASVHGSAAGFERAMAVLQRDSEHPMTTSSAASHHDRRSAASIGRAAAARAVRAADDSLATMRRLFVGSLVAVLASAGAAIAWGGVFWTIFVVATIATGGYVIVLRHRKLEADRAKAVIRSIRTDARAFVGRDQPHLYESLPRLVEGMADERHFPGGRPRTAAADTPVHDAAPQPVGARRSAVEVL
ncbi:hypothetical protein [Salsipaludibacter albus]|uniref:hypothetical protein n=1 Tax=Salsipaludibacter albus TaxID=2849650 RepID=UPI001EE4A7E5|nr:hypothetical protein [Salsipaludibacter albus]MBY5161996.1 hypothetical protein [Salsipaludibacter albus]